MSFEALVVQYGSLVGVAAVIAVVINLLKVFGLVKDGQAPIYSTGLNVLCLAVLFALQIFAPEVDVAGVDATAAKFAEAAMVVIGFFVQIGGAKLVHSLLKGVPLVGKSHSL